MTEKIFVYILYDLRNFNELFRKDVTYDDINLIQTNQIKTYLFFYMIYKAVTNLLYANYIVIHVWEDDLSGKP